MPIGQIAVKRDYLSRNSRYLFICQFLTANKGEFCIIPVNAEARDTASVP